MFGANPQAVVAMEWRTRVMPDAEFTREQAFASGEGPLGRVIGRTIADKSLAVSLPGSR